MRAQQKYYLVLGVGRSGCAAAALLLQRGQRVALCDDQVSFDEAVMARLRQRIAQLSGLGVVELDFAGAAVEVSDYDVLVLSPGVALSHPLVRAAQQAGVLQTSELEIALQGYGGRVVAITGTNGKSTTVSMVAHILSKQQSPCSLGGNLGTPVAELVCQRKLAALLILEVSSYQLEHSPRLSAQITVFLNFATDHLERHGSLRAYFLAKWQLVSNTPSGGVALIAREVAEAAERFLGAGAVAPSVCIVNETTAESSTLGQRAAQRLPHNHRNALFAVHAVKALGVPMSLVELADSLCDFRGLEHRFEVVMSRLGGGEIINDSKATNFASTRTSLACLTQPVILLLGGAKKAGDECTLTAAEKERVCAVLYFGASGQDLCAEMALTEIYTRIFPSLTALMASLVYEASAFPGADILFSPGCASFDEFQNFEDRGNAFKRMVKQVIEEESPS
ncbi:MAG: UDP-N-acetylmuramoyl-L-alanine--D-glutamate ligase [Zetaproteobacteria bacterium]|nr:UDP-N-acetylmuramoyl-L-alanine--D-glutamate ligase [Zetaproteobacteria bacterium]